MRRPTLPDKGGLLLRPGPAALLQTMPGIGRTTALTILAELGNLKRFKSPSAVANYAGLVPVIRDSNNKHYSGGITHRGSARPRAVLTEAARTAVRRVPIYEAPFERHAARGGRQVAIVALARRMPADAVRMLWKDEAFRFVPLTSAAGKADAKANSNRTGGVPSRSTESASRPFTTQRTSSFPPWGARNANRPTQAA